MKKEVFISILCAGLMLVSPFASIAQENKVSSNLSEQPDIDGLVAQIRTVVNEILQKYGHIPMVRSLCNVILNSLDLVGRIIFCIFLIILYIPLLWLCGFIVSTFGVIPPYIGFLWLLIAMIYDDYCPPSTPLNNLLSPFQSLYTLSVTKDITNLAKNCPCLQE